MIAGEQRVEEAEFVEDPQRRRVDRVAAKIAQEVGVLLEHRNLQPGAREQQRRDHAGRTATGNRDIEFGLSHGLTSHTRSG